MQQPATRCINPKEIILGQSKPYEKKPRIFIWLRATSTDWPTATIAVKSIVVQHTIMILQGGSVDVSQFLCELIDVHYRS